MLDPCGRCQVLSHLFIRFVRENHGLTGCLFGTFAFSNFLPKIRNGFLELDL